MTFHFKQFLCGLLILASGSLWAADAARVVFTAGAVKVAGKPVLLGQAVGEGQTLVTGQDGYLYLETLDKGFFILRPNSTGQIVSYRVDEHNPANTRIKIELQDGVARHISGNAVKAARENFRFNTPVAAVGVRGTDFTVFANQDTTRITVLSGGVIVSALSDSCVAAGFGPCEGPASRELFASSASQMLQINRGQLPMLLKGAELTPDNTAPPRPDEPAGGKLSGGASLGGTAGAAAMSNPLDPLKSDLLNQLANQSANQSANTSPAPTVGQPQLIWGRWQALLDQTIEVDVAALQATNQIIATNAYFALMRSRSSDWQPPAQATLGFALQQSQAIILNESSRQVSIAQVENGQLQVDFAKSTFFTRFDLVNQGERFQLQSSGEVTPDGKLFGGLQFLRPNNMSVSGALANDNATAAYLFQSRLDDQRLASGATFWGK